MSHPFVIRSATLEDAAALLEIYRPFVESTAISFETTVPSIEDFAARIAKSLTRWEWLVAEGAGHCIGYAYGSPLRDRAAYRWSVEVSVYVGPSEQRRGIGRTLYLELFDRLSSQGYCHAFAGITLPNEPSVTLHRALGFEPIGTFRKVGRKFGRWHDVAWLQRMLRELPPPERDHDR